MSIDTLSQDINISKDSFIFFFNENKTTSQSYTQKYEKDINILLLDIDARTNANESTDCIDYSKSVLSSDSKSVCLSHNDFINRYESKFLNLIKSTVFVSGENNAAVLMFADLLKKDKDATLDILNRIFIKALEDKKLNESLIVKIITLLNDYNYEYLFPVSQLIAACSLNIRSLRIKAAAFNLFGHWGNKEALNMLLKFEEPKELWLKMKYNDLKNALEKNVICKENK